ncbi:MAG: diguanylate cyclase [Nitrospirae bacterium]|nr:MAG: diguanylate cyclase [Nitrospirota bacterium]
MKTVVAVSKDMVLSGIVDRMLKDHFNIINFSDIESSLDYIYNSMPDMLVFDGISASPNAVRMLNELKNDPIFGQLPVLMLVPDDFFVADWELFFAEDYLRTRDVEKDLLDRIRLCLHRAERVVEVNPLTRLPGNIAISKQVQARLDKGDAFALAYADLDYFKPYNDKYGFSRGDEVLKMVGRLVMNMVKGRQPSGSFVGHIGGDDFTFMMDSNLVEQVAIDILDNFDRIITTFYDPEDRAKNNIVSIDREGQVKTFPFISLSIGIAHNSGAKFTHYGEIIEVASEMKKYAKHADGSCFRVDRRHYAKTN